MTTDLSGANWFKSSHSGGQTDCVEVAWLTGGHIGVRDSKNQAGPALTFTDEAWSGFTSVLRGNHPTTPL